MINFKQELSKILEEDPLGILKIQVAQTISPDQRLKDSFEEINKFVDEFGIEPKKSNNINERKLFSRLFELRKDFEKASILKNFDKHNLLKNVKEPKTVDDVLENDYLGLLSDENEDIFNIRNIPKIKSKTDFVARRKPCKNFHKFEDQFKIVQKEITSGKRKILVFKDNHCKEGGYYILDGILLFLEKIEGKNIKRFNDKSQGTRKRDDPRTRCIFENGMESNMYLRSLQKELYNNGSTVIRSNDESLKEFDENLGGINKEDKLSGHIYVLSSLSNKPEIQVIKDLYKIGYCTTSVEERTKGAENDPTYLMSPVKIVSSYKVFNLNPQKFENLIHTFFQEKCLNIKIADRNGKNIQPKEWYVIPIKIIERVIQLIISGEIIKFKYDAKNEELVKFD